MTRKFHSGIVFVMMINLLFLIFFGYLLACHYDTFAFISNYIHPLTGPDWDTFAALPSEEINRTLMIAIPIVTGIIDVANFAGCSYVAFGGKSSGQKRSIYPISLKEYAVIFVLIALVNYAYIFLLMQPRFINDYPRIWMPLADNFLLPMLFIVLVCYGTYKERKTVSSEG